MKFTIDTEAKTIELTEKTSIAELIKFLVSIGDDAENYSIIPNPIIYYSTDPYYGPPSTYDLNQMFCTTTKQ